MYMNLIHARVFPKFGMWWILSFKFFIQLIFSMLYLLFNQFASAAEYHLDLILSPITVPCSRQFIISQGKYYNRNQLLSFITELCHRALLLSLITELCHRGLSPHYLALSSSPIIEPNQRGLSAKPIIENNHWAVSPKPINDPFNRALSPSHFTELHRQTL